MADLATRFPYNPIQPGAFSTIDVAALANRDTTPGAPVPAFIGAATGGTPGQVLYFRDAMALKSVLRSGPLFDAARLALIGGASRVAVVRVIGAAAAPATLILAGSAGTGVTLTAKDTGAWTNAVKVLVEALNKVTITYVDALGATFTEVFSLGTGATAQQVADAINGLNPTIQGSSFVNAVAGAGTMPLATLTLTNLAGGNDGGAPVGADWTNALTPLETEEVSIVVAATADNTVHAQVKAHCDAMSTVAARKSRTTLFGGAVGETTTATIARAAALRAARAQVVYPGMVMLNSAGVPTLYDPFFRAALFAGMHCALPDAATSLTHARTVELDVERRLSTAQGGEVEQLLAAGVTVAAPAPGSGIWIVDSLSTYITDQTFRDFHKIRSADASAARLRTRLEDKFCGGKTLDGTALQVKQETIAELDDQKTIQLIRGHLDPSVTTDPNNPSKLLVNAPVQLIDTQKYLMITVALQPSSVVTA